MRRADAAVAAKTTANSSKLVGTPVQFVCLALLLAIATLAHRIVSAW
jgi:hypothetical protein